MRYLALSEALELHRRLIDISGGAHGVRDLGLLESALAQPRLTFDGHELYTDAVAKAGALGFSLIQNHAFVDGNKRIGHAVMETFLMLNGYEIAAHVDAGTGRLGRRIGPPFTRAAHGLVAEQVRTAHCRAPVTRA